MVKDSGEKKHKHTKNSLVSSTDEEFDKLIGETVQPGSDVLGGFEREYNEDTETEKIHLSDKDNTMERRSDQIVNILNNSVDSFEENQEFELSEHSYEGENADSRNDDFDEYYQNFLNTRDRNYRNNNIGFPRGRFGGKAVFSSAKKRSLVKIAVIFSTIVFLICGFRAIFGGTDTKAESMKVTEASNVSIFVKLFVNVLLDWIGL
ncbi:hypothetical protein AX774_g4170 [Zancudomyces culisetae]|uniref:Uncharacterized protein n=1 Tax=Zancudomyces culisetae TaxID=1213189 RepID=A0A1R1PN08_ZANCU|nr:hypothetical protein AX774_g4170 [Zancudomyces culisetae]|eukprot:OMH82347.1 hypothetical protein AX774_g4170 [Zancudomyces culisetae]